MIYVIVIALVTIIKVFKILKIKQFFHGKSLNDNDGRSSLILNSCPKDFYVVLPVLGIGTIAALIIF